MAAISIRKMILKVHLWLGLAAVLFVVTIAGTGTLLVFDHEIDRLLNPRLLVVIPQGQRLPITVMLDRARPQLPGRSPINIFMDPRPTAAWGMITSGKKDVAWAYVNPYTGEVTGTRPFNGWFMAHVMQLHRNLLLGKNGERCVGYSTVAMLV